MNTCKTCLLIDKIPDANIDESGDCALCRKHASRNPDLEREKAEFGKG